MVYFYPYCPSIRELNTIIQAYADRKKAESKERVYQAYLISRWVWQKRINIESILNNIGRERKIMTDEQMFAQARALNAIFGGKERTCKP